MSPDEAAEILYGLAAADWDTFATRRAELVKQARAEGDKQSAAEIGKFRKPVQAAALTNLLVRDQPKAVAELTTVATRLRDAHRHLRGDELRALSEQRQKVLGKLTELGRKAATKPVGETVLGQLRATFEAAIADEAAEQAVLSGRLTAALSYSGFGEVDLSDAVALPPPLRAVPDLPPDEPTGPSPEVRAARRGPAERALARAERNHAEALDSVDEAVEALAAARDAEQELTDRIAELTAALADARSEATKAAKAVTAAEREHGRATRGLERAEQAVRNAQAELDG